MWEEMSFYVYRFLTDDEVLYVGRTNNIESRMYAHMKTSEFYKLAVSIDFMTFESRTDMVIAELYLIDAYKPHYNIMEKSQSETSLFNIDLPPYKVFAKKQTPRNIRSIDSHRNEQQKFLEHGFKIKSFGAYYNDFFRITGTTLGSKRTYSINGWDSLRFDSIVTEDINEVFNLCNDARTLALTRS